ncbi:MAG: SOS response-associated peptidase family protein [Atopobiaceae bacterium]|nr:SOS response-associated peptidase family protein [Atopobiaceae bacterium]
MPLFVPNEESDLQVAELVWGFETTIKGAQKLVFNTRMDTALRQLASGKGLWANSMTHGRCLVPVRAFYESWTKSTERRRTDVRFTMPGRQVFLLAGVQENGRFSIVTTNPNADVGAYHTRMPLVLAPGESKTWLGPGYASLAYRSKIRLDAEPEL